MAGIKSMTVEVFDGTTAMAKSAALASRKEVKTVLAHARSSGFTPSTKSSDFQGFKRSYKPDGVVSEGEQTVTRLDHTYQVQELKKAGSKDFAAVVISTFNAVGVSGGTQTDVRYLFAPGGDITKTTEMKFDHATGKVVSTNSWFSRLKACVGSKCSAPCKDALTSCLASGGIAGYLICFARKCGGCSAKCVACASCNCRWWCKWAAGCCQG